MDFNEVVHFMDLVINLSFCGLHDFSSFWDEVVHFKDFNKVVHFMDFNEVVHFIDFNNKFVLFCGLYDLL